MNNNKNFCQSNSKNSFCGYSDYWRQSDIKTKTSSSGYSSSGSSSSSSNKSSFRTSTSNSGYHVPSICQNSFSGLRVW